MQWIVTAREMFSLHCQDPKMPWLIINDYICTSYQKVCLMRLWHNAKIRDLSKKCHHQPACLLAKSEVMEPRPNPARKHGTPNVKHILMFKQHSLVTFDCSEYWIILGWLLSFISCDLVGLGCDDVSSRNVWCNNAARQLLHVEGGWKLVMK